MFNCTQRWLYVFWITKSNKWIWIKIMAFVIYLVIEWLYTYVGGELVIRVFTFVQHASWMITHDMILKHFYCLPTSTYLYHLSSVTSAVGFAVCSLLFWLQKCTDCTVSMASIGKHQHLWRCYESVSSIGDVEHGLKTASEEQLCMLWARGRVIRVLMEVCSCNVMIAMDSWENQHHIPCTHRSVRLSMSTSWR